MHFLFELAAQSFGSLIYFNHSKNLLTILFVFLHQRWQLFNSEISKDVNNPSSTYPETSHHSVHALGKKRCHCRCLCHFIPCRSANAVLCQTISKADWARVFYKLIQDEEPNALEFLEGFKNLRLRCREDLYSHNYTAANFSNCCDSNHVLDSSPSRGLCHRGRSQRLYVLMESSSKAVKRPGL